MLASPAPAMSSGSTGLPLIFWYPKVTAVRPPVRAAQPVETAMRYASKLFMEATRLVATVWALAMIAGAPGAVRTPASAAR